MADVHEIDEDEVGPPVGARDLPPWLREYRGFLRVNRLLDGSGEWLLRCRACDLALGIDPTLARRLPVDGGLAETIPRLGAHGLEHAVNGELEAVGGRGPIPGG
jgi:hypothetical protein